MLDKIMQLKGAIAAGEFSKTDGSLLRHLGDLSKENAEMIARMCKNNTELLTEQARQYNEVSQQNWMPLKGWAVSAGDYTVCVVDNFGVILETASADFNQAFFELRMAAQYKYEMDNM